MDPTRPEPSHTAEVDAWIDTWIHRTSDAAGAVSLAEPVDLFRAAVEALWQRAVTTLGAVTLTAIAERVLVTATERYGFLSVINPRPNGDLRWKQALRERLMAVSQPDLVEALRFGMIELLTVIGRLTAEILSPELHAVLAEITPASIETTQQTGLHAVPVNAAGNVQS
jgi:hypothetical protein